MVAEHRKRPPKSHIIHDHNLINPATPVAQAKIFIQQLQRPELIGSFNNQTTTIITTVIKRNARQLGNDVFLCYPVHSWPPSGKKRKIKNPR